MTTEVKYFQRILQKSYPELYGKISISVTAESNYHQHLGMDGRMRAELNYLKPKVMKEGEQPKKPESQIITEGKDPVKKKRPYYRKKYNKPKPVEVIQEPVKSKNYFIHGLAVGIVITSIIARVIWVFS